MSDPKPFGISGRIARAFQSSQITPLLALVGVLLGLMAVIVTPREEDPQIEVTMATITVPFAGADTHDVANLVAFPLEQKVSEILGIKHVYAVSRPGVAIVTVEFEVGVPRQEAIIRLYNKVYSNLDWIPPGLGVGQPIIKPMGINDVPIMTLTLWSDHADRVQLAEVAHTLETTLKRVSGTRDVYTVGAPERAVLVKLDPAKLADYHMTVDDLAGALKATNAATDAGEVFQHDTDYPVKAGTLLMDAGAVRDLVIGLSGGSPVHVSDVAEVTGGGNYPTSYAFYGTPAGLGGPATGLAPAVTIAIAKKQGANAIDVTDAVRARLAQLENIEVPADVHVMVTRDSGRTADAKARELMDHLLFATLSVVLLVLLALGWREAIVVGTAVLVTLAITLFASYMIGFTINRVSLFALIFSIGILVDDAIVVVENIHRHMAMGDRKLGEVIPLAVDEVGGPTILATFTVIAALVPMAFVGGLMGPYMRPIPVNASAGMLISLAVAFVVSPWMAGHLLGRHAHRHDAGEDEHAAARASRLDRGLHALFKRVMTPFLAGERARRNRRRLFAAMGLLVALAAGLVVVKVVILKMLPFDNKSEFQVVLDMPEGATLERTQRALVELGQVLAKVPEVTHYELYAGAPAPIDFNGLVRQYFLRSAPYQGMIEVNLRDKDERKRQSHAIAMAVRPQLAAVAKRFGAHLAVVEIPPGPPVQAPIVAEIFGPNYAVQRRIALAIEKMFAQTRDIVDIGSSVENPAAQRKLLVVDRARAATLGVSQQQIVDAIAAGLSGVNASYLQDGAARHAIPIVLRLPQHDLGSLESVLELRVRSSGGGLIPLSEVVRVETVPWSAAVYHKDLLPVTYVTGDDAGREDSPLYGMFKLVGAIGHRDFDGFRLGQHFVGEPQSDGRFSIKWGGEWTITYETFRDMGLAYSAGLVLIYLLVVGQFRSYVVPLIIMAPIPLTVIGVMPGHALFHAQFTATSMIGMIALAGIIVRNSILLVDFINHAVAAGKPLEEAVIEAGAVRAKPIILTAVAAMLGAFFILSDPIFQGLAVSLVFGVLVSTVLTLIVIPLLYYAWLSHRAPGKPAGK
ncbi:MAG: RND efflux system, inner membrane transporter [Rhodanobacteraceae bacterium]|jgi:multidrug efflux pump subunit AcrB|nr:MAG: RND efflux system, inner membrane transporter [Rhodanobacteraceae bacterium]